MIKMKLYGGIGNQLFQWAFAKSLSVTNNCSYILDDSHYEICNKHFYTLDRLPKLQDECKLSRDQSCDFRVIDPLNYVEIQNLPNDKTFYFDGYWQCEKYFKQHEDVIRSYLEPHGDIKERLLSRYGSKLNNSVSIHVRRTDYLDSNGFHPVADNNYYEKALESVGQIDNIFIFSDDLKWCKNTFKADNIVFAEGNSNVEDLWLMSMCSNNIIANSSYSWWGSWLNSNPNKTVVAPSKWFGIQNNNKQVYLDSWIVI